MGTIVLQRSFADVGRQILLALLQPLLRLPKRVAWLAIEPFLLSRMRDLETMLTVGSAEELEAYLATRRLRWTADLAPLAMMGYASDRIRRTMRRGDRSTAQSLQVFRDNYDELLKLIDNPHASQLAVTNARVASFSFARAATAFSRDEIDLEHPLFKRIRPWSLLPVMQETVMVWIALWMGLIDVSYAKHPKALDVLSERLLRDADTLAEYIGEARKAAAVVS